MFLNKVDKQKKPLVKMMYVCVVWLVVASVICKYTG